jgi:hypothetical protein
LSPTGARLPGLLGRKSACEAVANRGGERPIEPRNACDKDEGPGPGTDVPEAPASGASFSKAAWDPVKPDIGICPRAGGVPAPGDAARRAVEDCLDGEPERVDSGRKEEDGTGLGLGDPGGLSSVFVNRPAMFRCVCGREGVREILEVQVDEVWYRIVSGRADKVEAGLSSETQ